MIFLMKNKPNIRYALIWHHFSKIILAFGQLRRKKSGFYYKKVRSFFRVFLELIANH